ncbi:hypothetical protein CKAH01_08665 [Colletotrichum kahawae]|uniref:Clr5 domain-containing protein n=1 Tax=Colletotrichum kahawae TaxID=34407 RepID=A0AAE0D1G6_COLKA|nr:hypothetical protein CKAH01_08665 [Colletotrichum kahawae]
MTPLTQTVDRQIPWEAMKEVIRGLYLVENLTLKDVINIMKEKHGFSATERMYKRRFISWDWQKYNKKERHNPDRIIERYPGRARATCRRAHRRQMQIARSNNPPVPEPNMLQFFRFCHANRVEELRQGLFYHLRDLIVGNSRLDPEWNQRGKHTLLESSGDRLSRHFKNANDLHGTANDQQSWAIWRQFFLRLESFVEDPPIETYQAFFFDIPSKLLQTKRRDEPITRVARAMHQLNTEAPLQMSLVIEEMHNIAADCYIELRGQDDLTIVFTRMRAIRPRNVGRGSRWCEPILSSCSNILQGAMERFGEFSDETLFVELWRLGAASLCSTPECILQLSTGIIIRLMSSNEGLDLSEWGLEDLQHYAWVNFNISKAYAESGQIEASIPPLKESIEATGYVLVYAEDEASRERANTQLVSRYGKLEKRLRLLGKLAEADKFNAYITKSTYLEEEEQNDVAENLDSMLAPPNSQER